MQWHGRLPRVPQRGSKRTVRRFAFFPTTVDGDDARPHWLWLEWYDVQQEYSDNGYTACWVTVARYTTMDV